MDIRLHITRMSEALKDYKHFIIFRPKLVLKDHLILSFNLLQNVLEAFGHAEAVRTCLSSQFYTEHLLKNPIVGWLNMDGCRRCAPDVQLVSWLVKVRIYPQCSLDWFEVGLFALEIIVLTDTQLKRNDLRTLLMF